MRRLMYHPDNYLAVRTELKNVLMRYILANAYCRTSECEGTFDKHRDRLWAMALIQRNSQHSNIKSPSSPQQQQLNSSTTSDNATEDSLDAAVDLNGVSAATAAVNGTVELITGGADRWAYTEISLV